MTVLECAVCRCLVDTEETHWDGTEPVCAGCCGCWADVELGTEQVAA